MLLGEVNRLLKFLPTFKGSHNPKKANETVVLPRLWKLVVTTARRLNVQVFATTHSWDGIETFQAALRDDQEDDSMLVRLESRDGDVRAISFNKDELAIVTREQIEVR